VELPRADTLNGLDAAARGAAEGMHLVINILAMLIAFIGLVALANYGIAWLDGLVNGTATGWSLQATAGVFFHPLVWLMGIPWAEAGLVGELMGLKTILNEFVAYLALSQHMGDAAALSQRSFIITTYALCGFANFGSVAIMIGGIGGIAPERRGDLARLGLRSLVGGTLATMLTGCMIGLYL
jgi:CNT family concentrative nucleoside transporter